MIESIYAAFMLQTAALALLTGSLVYCALAMRAAWLYLRSGAPPAVDFPPVSVLRPMAGAEAGAEVNLRSVFAQTYGAEFEVLIGVHEESDPAAAVARRVMAEFPDVPARLIVTGISPLPNAKVWSLRALLSEARHEHLLMTDSDIRLAPDCLATMMTELAGANVGLVTCPYRAVGGPRFWSRVEALGLNTDFLAGMLTQRMLNGMDFAIGCAIATRRADLAAIGGFEFLQGYLAEDFMMGNRMRAAGREVVLSRSVIEHHIGNDGFAKNWKHRMRWARSTRRSRPWGYAGQLFTHPVVLGLLLTAANSDWWELMVAALIFRLGVAWCMAVRTLRDTKMPWWLLPVSDGSSFAVWALGFFGRRISWRGRMLVVASDGTFEVSA